MTRRMYYTKDDVERAYWRGHNRQQPAVNVKVYGNWRNVDFSTLDVPDWFTRDWVAEHTNDGEGLNTWFDAACEDGWEDLTSDARFIFEPEYADTYPYRGRIKVYAAGRSGGWCVVEGLPDIDSWDAIMLAKWRKFERWARAGADYIPAAMLELFYLNAAEPIHDAEIATEIYASRQELGV